MAEADREEQAQSLARDYAHGLAAIDGDRVDESVGSYIADLIERDTEAWVADLTQFMVAMMHSDVKPDEMAVKAAHQLHEAVIESLAAYLKDSPNGLDKWLADKQQEVDDERGEERARARRERGW